MTDEPGFTWHPDIDCRVDLVRDTRCYDGELVTIEMTVAEALDFHAGRAGVSTWGEGDPFITPDGRPGVVHRTAAAEQVGRAQQAARQAT
jgi:hypothetical protein